MEVPVARIPNPSPLQVLSLSLPAQPPSRGPASRPHTQWLRERGVADLTSSWGSRGMRRSCRSRCRCAGPGRPDTNPSSSTLVHGGKFSPHVLGVRQSLGAIQGRLPRGLAWPHAGHLNIRLLPPWCMEVQRLFRCCLHSCSSGPGDTHRAPSLLHRGFRVYSQVDFRQNRALLCQLSRLGPPGSVYTGSSGACMKMIVIV